jgi:hypothetical protein
MKQPIRLTRIQRAQVPMQAGQRASLDHLPGMNPRRYKFTEGTSGTNPKVFGGRHAKGMSQSTAPHKHQSGLFSPSFSIAGPGLTEEV